MTTDGVAPWLTRFFSQVLQVIPQSKFRSLYYISPGDYMFQVTDANGCTYQELYTIADVTPIAIVGALVMTLRAANGTTNNGSQIYCNRI
jgi:hypothetical protein